MWCFEDTKIWLWLLVRAVDLTRTENWRHVEDVTSGKHHMLRQVMLCRQYYQLSGKWVATWWQLARVNAFLRIAFEATTWTRRVLKIVKISLVCHLLDARMWIFQSMNLFPKLSTNCAVYGCPVGVIPCGYTTKQKTWIFHLVYVKLRPQSILIFHPNELLQSKTKEKVKVFFRNSPTRKHVQYCNFSSKILQLASTTFLPL